ncbi:CynX/NimT family MFS transporter [Promicromonospora sp. Marseille-Q5078]
MTSYPSRSGARDDGARTGLLLAALLLVALNLRAPITSLPPVVDEVAAGLGLTPTGVGLLTSVPVLCFALCTPLASVLVARTGPELALGASLAGILAGTMLRSAGSVPAALAGTAVVGIAIAIGNVAVPVVITRDFRRRAAAVTGAYSAMMNLGSTFTTMLTVPLATAFGWQWALAGWGVLAVAALVAWVPAGRHLAARGRTDGAPSAARVRPPSARAELAALDPAARRSVRRLVVLLSVAFAGQASGYYAVTAWLPEILHDRLGMSAAGAGSAAAPFQLCAVLGSFIVPAGLARGLSSRAVAVLLSAMWLSLPLGLLLAPDLWLLWVGLAGAAQGGNFTAIFTLVAQRSPGIAVARRASAVVQTAGYGCAALAPTVAGAVHEATGGWTAPLVVVAGVLAVMAVAMWLASARQRA